MRVAFVHSFYSSRTPSGENGVVRSEIDTLRRAGVEVELFALHNDDLMSQPGYKARSAVRVATGRGRSPLRELEAWGPDVIHIHNLFPNFGRTWVERLSVPFVHTLHNFRPLCAKGTLTRNGEVCTECIDRGQWRGLRHRCHLGSFAATLPLSIANVGGPARDPVISRAARLIVLSPTMRDLYADQGVPSEKMTVWPNFLPDDQVPALDAGPREGWLFVGRLSEEKGILPLVNGWPEQANLLVIGDGPLLEAVTDAARDKDIAVVGPRPHGDVLKAMRARKGLVFPSRWLEGAPLVHVEALACGLPVLATEPSVLARIVEEEGSGARFSDPLQLANAVADNRLPAIDPSRCREVFDSKYSESAYVDRAVGLYRTIIRAG